MDVSRMAVAKEDTNEQRLIGLLRHQQVLYRRLRQLAERQKTLVLESDAAALIELLSERQRLVDGLLGLNGQLAPFRARWSDVFGSLTEPSRRAVAEMLEEANQSLGAIIEGDQRDSATLTARKQGMAEELTGFGAGGRVTAAYAASGAVHPSALTEAKG